MEKPITSYPFHPEEYPGNTPSFSYFLSKDFVHELQITADLLLSKAIVNFKAQKIELPLLLRQLSVEPLEDRYAILGYGSNASPDRLIKKGISNLPIVRVFAKNLDVVYAYEKTDYGAIPATIVESPSTLTEIWVSFLNEEQLGKMDGSEGRKGGHYDLVELKNNLIFLPNCQVISPAYAYVSNKKGVALRYRKPIALEPIQAVHRKFDAISEKEVLNIIDTCERGESADHLNFEVIPVGDLPKRFEEAPYEILNEFLSIYNRLTKPPRRKSNKGFIGNLFSEIIANKMERYLSPEHKIVHGPLWIGGFEWIEWDGAIIKKAAEEIFPKFFHSEDIIALFELKTRGIYGRKHPGKGKTVQEVIDNIKKNFCLAKERCTTLKRCFYVSLQERTPKRKDSIKYYKETKKLEPEVVTCILFHSPIKKAPRIPYPNEWNRLVTELKRL